jgi:predicted amidohydrolase
VLSAPARGGPIIDLHARVPYSSDRHSRRRTRPFRATTLVSAGDAGNNFAAFRRA